ncbi:hypothetical protein Lal_00005109 [Lupinus albus]|nr:hypothetical protein Lal_00005109 [Lupinus albus]
MSEQKLTGAQIVIKALKDQGVDIIFGYPGGAVLPIYDALFQQNDLKHVLVRHEQAAVHAAEGYARSTGKVGCVLVTSGPGATNAVTGLLDALCDSIPLVCLSGQVPTHLIGNDAFQEADTTGITRPCTKHNYLVKDVDNLARTLHEAFYVARSGRPGPVLVDIPKDVQFADGTYVPPAEVKHKTYRPQVKPEIARIEEAIELIANAKRPVFYTGGGVINAVRQDHRLPDHLHPDGAGRLPGVRKPVAGHARHARHVRGESRHVRMRRDDQHRRPLRRPRHRQAVGLLAGLQEDPCRHRSQLDQQERRGRHSHRRRLRRRSGRHAAHLEGARQVAGQGRAEGVVGQDRGLARPQLPELQPHRIGHQAAVCAGAPARGPARQGPLHHDGSRPAPDVGRPVPALRPAEPLDDLGRSRHHGLRPAGGHRRPAGSSRRHRGGRVGRGQLPDEHAGDRHRRAVPRAGQDLHPEQPVYGHGAPVAGAAARIALFPELLGSPAGLREAGGILGLRRLARHHGGRGRPGDREDADGHRPPLHHRHRRRSEGELLPDDSGRQGPQRNPVRSGRQPVRRHAGRRHGAGLIG